jgi:putative two-component system response regulator
VIESSSGTILIVDDEAAKRDILSRMLRAGGYDVATAENGDEALNWLEARRPDVILLDVMMPGVSGFEVCRRIKERPFTRLIPVVMITGLRTRDDRIKGITSGADDFLSKPFDADELRARVASLVRAKRYTDELESAESVIVSLALTIEARDPYTDGHCRRLAEHAVALGRRIGLAGADLETLRRGGFLHDVGKIAVPDHVLLKTGRLTPEEFAIVKTHPVVGERLCGDMRSLEGIRPIVRSHHERLDGSGNPDGLRGGAIPLHAQIMSIVDGYDAMTTTRAYRPRLTASHAIEELQRDAAAGRLDRALVEAFVSLRAKDASERSPT